MSVSHLHYGVIPLEDKPDVLTLTAEIVASYVGANSHVQAAEIPNIIRQVRAALSEDAPGQQDAQPEETRRPVLKSAMSITPDALTSFVDNKPYKTLKRHLSRHGMTMADYRQRYGLPSDYPSVAPNYSAARSEMAKRLGLGAQRRGQGAAGDKAAAKPGRKKADA